MKMKTITFYSFCSFHFHADQIITSIHATSMKAKNIYEALVFPPPITQRIVITLATMFDQRFALYCKILDRTIIAIGISTSNENINKNAWGSSKDIISFKAPGFKNPIISAKIMLNITKIHRYESFTFISTFSIPLLLVFIFISSCTITEKLGIALFM